jgi:RNA polymerase primary sigma factor
VTRNFLEIELDEILESLNEREQQVIREHLMEGKRQEDISAEWGVARSRPHQVLKKALRKLRHPGHRRKLRDFLGCDDGDDQLTGLGWTAGGEWAFRVS